MLYINPASIPFPQARLEKLKKLTKELISALPSERSNLIDHGRNDSWGHADVVTALRSVVGNKCWYSEVYLDHNDPNVDHFRPKGEIREVDIRSFKNCGESRGYWWLAFEHCNYRFAAIHANQRRVFTHTSGGKWDYFPVRGSRAVAKTQWSRIVEDFLPLDPCLKSDVMLLWFDPDGVAGPADRQSRPLTDHEKDRVRVSIWLYHLDEENTQKRRAETIRGVLALLDEANDNLQDWDPTGSCDLKSKARFDASISKIQKALEPKSLFAGAVERVVRTRSAHYPWIIDYITL